MSYSVPQTMKHISKKSFHEKYPESMADVIGRKTKVPHK